MSRLAVPHQATVLVSSAAVTNSHRWGGVNSRQWFLTVLEAGSPAGPVSGASPLPGLQMVAVLLYSHGVERQRQEASSVGSVIRTLISFMRPPSQPQSPPGPTSSIPSHWNLGWTPRIWGDTHWVHSSHHMALPTACSPSVPRALFLSAEPTCACDWMFALLYPIYTGPL